MLQYQATWNGNIWTDLWAGSLASTKLHSTHDWRVSGLGKRQFSASSPAGQQEWFDLPVQLRTASNLFRMVSWPRGAPGDLLRAADSWRPACCTVLRDLTATSSSLLTPLARGSMGCTASLAMQGAHSSSREQLPLRGNEKRAEGTGQPYIRHFGKSS